jgi:hypothetical protein
MLREYGKATGEMGLGVRARASGSFSIARWQRRVVASINAINILH